MRRDNRGTVERVSRNFDYRGTRKHAAEEKIAYIRKLIDEKGQIVAFVGDVSMTARPRLAHIGIAMEAGRTSPSRLDVVLMTPFSAASHALGLSKPRQEHEAKYHYSDRGRCSCLRSIFQRMDEHVASACWGHEAVFAVILNGMRLLRYRSDESVQ